MVLVMAQNDYATRTHVAHDSALSVGMAPHDAAKVRELEEEVLSLADKANSASQRFADYENEIRVLRAQLRQQQRRNAAAENASAGEAVPPTPSGISRFGSFMHSRKMSPISAAMQAPSAREKELEAALVKEQTARIAAEKKVREVNAEIEDLSASLFQQANEMVASERKMSAVLQGKVEALEKEAHDSGGSGDEAMRKENARLREKVKLLEQREVDRKRRLEKLEAANERINRVRATLVAR